MTSLELVQRLIGGQFTMVETAEALDQWIAERLAPANVTITVKGGVVTDVESDKPIKHSVNERD